MNLQSRTCSRNQPYTLIDSHKVFHQTHYNDNGSGEMNGIRNEENRLINYRDE